MRVGDEEKRVTLQLVHKWSLFGSILGTVDVPVAPPPGNEGQRRGEAAFREDGAGER